MQPIGLSLLMVLWGTGAMPVQADTTAVPSLIISQLKVTSSNGQFVTLYNPSGSALNMSNYQLEYFNSFDLSKATSSKLIQLTGTLPPHGYFMVNDGALQLCYQMTVDSVSLGFSTTAGMVELLAMNQASPGTLITSSLQDYVGWSKSAAAGAQTLPSLTSAFMQRLPLDGQNNPVIAVPGSGSWQSVQPDPSNACGLVSATNSTLSVATGLSQLLPASEPPVTILPADGSGVTTTSLVLPSADIGLMAPQITELLPNPNGTGNDSTDEFIELYNANDATFDLTGFSLQSGLTTLHTYVFPAGSTLASQSFTAFHADVTKLTLSNSGSQVKLLDPFGNVIAATDVYGSATDGQSWALANGKWYWTIQPTPDAANVIKQPPVKATKISSSKKTTTKATGTVPSVPKNLKVSTAAKSSVAGVNVPTAPIHPWMLALVAGAALLYGIYEYRLDLANRLRESRAKLGIGGFAWPKFARWRGDRTGE